MIGKAFIFITNVSTLPTTMVI